VLTSHKQFTDDIIENLLKPNPNLSAVNTVAIWQIVDETGGNAFPLELSDSLGERILKETKFKLVDRSTLEAILKEQKMSGEGVIDPASRQQVKLLGIDAYLFGRLSKTDERSRTLVLKLLSVDTGELLWINKSSAEWLLQLEGMVQIPAGWFLMGSPYPGLQHKVWVDAFLIDRCEVTNAQYEKFMKATGHKAPVDWNNDNFNKPDHPVAGVSWFDAEAYAKWAGKRLPTEAEWEKAARGGLVGKIYPWGDSISHDNANDSFEPQYGGTGGRDRWAYTSPVGSFPPNGYGLYDVAGNASEWCADWYHEDYYRSSPERNPKGPETGSGFALRPKRFDVWFVGRVLRGGALRCASRSRWPPNYTEYPNLLLEEVGFRCARDP